MNGLIGKWLVAIPGVVGFKNFFRLCKKNGFMVFPNFLDNFFHPQKGESNFKRFWRLLKKHEGEVEVAIYPDFRYDLDFLLNNYQTKWVFPLHKKSEIDFVLTNQIEWVGIPYRKSRRDYTIEWFIDFCDEHSLKKWYLGWFYRVREKANILLHFDGLDTTCLTKYCVINGKAWIDWDKLAKYETMPRLQFFDLSLKNFRASLEELSKTGVQTLVPYIQTKEAVQLC